MEWLTNNWWIMIIGIAIASYIICTVYDFIREPSDVKIKNIKEWLKYAVLQAEKELGSGTGQAKLRMVYGMAVDKFPWIEAAISFNTFSEWVDEALVWLENQLATNEAIKTMVGINEDK